MDEINFLEYLTDKLNTLVKFYYREIVPTMKEQNRINATFLIETIDKDEEFEII